MTYTCRDCTIICSAGLILSPLTFSVKCLAFNIFDLQMIVYNYVFNVIQGAYFAWKATAMGKNYVNGKTFLEKRQVH